MLTLILRQSQLCNLVELLEEKCVTRQSLHFARVHVLQLQPFAQFVLLGLGQKLLEFVVLLAALFQHFKGTGLVLAELGSALLQPVTRITIKL